MTAGASHLACIIGYPVAQSLSPAIHTAAFQALGLDWTYIAIAVQPGAAQEGVSLLRELGVEGASVTMPHKQDVIPFLDEVIGDASRTGAVNTIVASGKRLVGHNTDGDGFLRFLRADVGLDPAGARVLMLGAGGAARAVAFALDREGAQVTIAARRPQQAAEVAALSEGIRAAPWGEAIAFDLVVNATPMRDGLPELNFGEGSVAVDMIYVPPETSLIRDARESGARAFDGLGMLVHQATLAFELWTGIEAPVEVMHAAARSALDR